MSGWVSQNRGHHGWEAGFWKGVGREFLVETQVSCFSLAILFCPVSVNWPYASDPGTPGRPLSRAFVGWVADIPGFPMFPRKSESKDRTVPKFSGVPPLP